MTLCAQGKLLTVRGRWFGLQRGTVDVTTTTGGTVACTFDGTSMWNDTYAFSSLVLLASASFCLMKLCRLSDCVQHDHVRGARCA